MPGCWHPNQIDLYCYLLKPKPRSNLGVTSSLRPPCESPNHLLPSDTISVGSNPPSHPLPAFFFPPALASPRPVVYPKPYSRRHLPRPPPLHPHTAVNPSPSSSALHTASTAPPLLVSISPPQQPLPSPSRRRQNEKMDHMRIS